MADPANVMKMLQALGGGMASESYGTGRPMQGGQPLLPKPQISRPDLLSPYAPGLNNGEVMHNQGSHVPPQPNSGTGQKPSKMGNADAHPANQLAQYLVTNGRGFRATTDPGAHIRGMGVGG